MPRSRKRLWWIGGGLLGLSLAVALSVPIAEACGIVTRKLAPESRPSLAWEKVLLVYDAEAKKEHFVREVAFARASETFGFVVPTPSRPTVAAIDKKVFTHLRDLFPYFDPEELGPSESGYGRGSGAGFGGRAVTVLEVERVGSFQAYVLHATDEQALAKWLADNDLVATEATEEWLAHYVRLGFYYVAMRYDPPRRRKTDAPDDEHPIAAEAVRITFDTPLPYYPYLEPLDPTRGDEPRVLEVFYVGPERVVPVAMREREGGAPAWVRPLRPGKIHEDGGEMLREWAPAQLAALVPEGPVLVQTFQDQKRSRAGFGDILFVPEAGGALTEARIAELQPLLALMDPSLVPAAPAQSEGE